MNVDLVVTLMLVAGAVAYLSRIAHKKTQRVLASGGRCGSCSSGCEDPEEQSRDCSPVSLTILGKKS